MGNIKGKNTMTDVEKYKKTKRFIQSGGVYNILRRTITYLLPDNRKIYFNLNMDGGSYTDGKSITVGVPTYWWGAEDKKVFSALKALTGHETEHCVSSDFDLFVKFQQKVADDFSAKYNFPEHRGKQLGRHLLNSVEDGRIERRLGNRMNGYVKHIKYLNAVIWDNQPVQKEDPMKDFLFCMTSMCVTGLKSKDWSKHYGETDLDELLDEIRPLIIKGIKEKTAKGCAERTFEIYEIIAPKLAELLEDEPESINSLPLDFDFYLTDEYKGDAEDVLEINVSTHLISEESPKEQGNNQAKSSSESTEDTEKDKENDSDKSEGEQQEAEENKADNQDGQNLNDTSEDVANEEENLVKDFLKNAEEEMKTEMIRDMDQINKEEEKIEKEKERIEKESVNLTPLELEDVLSGKRSFDFENIKLETYEKELPSEIQSQGKKLKRKLEKILKDKEGYTSRNRKRGVLDPTNIWKLGVKDYNTFVKKGKPTDSSFVVSVLIDNSGSMTEQVDRNKQKAEYAQEACAILEEGLKGLVPHKITRFDERYRTVKHEILSDFGDVDKMNRTWSNNMRIGGLNADSVSIRVATKELLKRSEQKKILFVLSDGLPSSYSNTDEAISSVKNAVRDARKSGVIVIAICFGSNQHLENTRERYHEMYQQGIIMTETQNIPSQIVKVLEREIK